MKMESKLPLWNTNGNIQMINDRSTSSSAAAAAQCSCATTQHARLILRYLSIPLPDDQVDIGDSIHCLGRTSDTR